VFERWEAGELELDAADTMIGAIREDICWIENLLQTIELMLIERRHRFRS
jgi:hypothetical protein